MEYEGVVITTKGIAYHDAKILNASHDDDGIWQFLEGSDVELIEDEAIITSLDEILHIDPTLMEILSLPIGSRAFRNNVGSQWVLTNDN